MNSNAENSNGLKEDWKLTRVIGLMACGALASASLWLFNLSQAQDQEQPQAPPWAMQPAANTPASENQSADPFAGVSAGFRPVNDTESTGTQTVIRQRIQNELRLAVKAREEGKPEEAMRRAVAARDLAQRFKIAFAEKELTPNALISQLNGQSAPPADAPNPENRQEYAQYLVRTSREYLQSGNIEAALEKAQQAQKLGVTYGPFDDRPEHVLADIAQLKTSPDQQQLADGFSESPFFVPASTKMAAQDTKAAPEVPAANVTSPTNGAKAQSQQLLGAAEKAIQEGRYDDARKLATQAAELPVVYNLFDKKPDQILAVIERATNSQMIAANQPKMTPPAEVTVTPVPTVKAPAVTPEPEVVQAAPVIPNATPAPQMAPAPQVAATTQAPAANGRPYIPADSAPAMATSAQSSHDREMAMNLLAEARQAVSKGNLSLAKAKVAQARQFNVTYDIFDDRPELLMAEIEAVQKQQMLAQQNTAPTTEESSVDPVAGVELAQKMQATPIPNEVSPADNAMVETSIVTADQAGTEISGQDAYREGVTQLRGGNREAARQAFLVAFENQSDLTGQQKQQLQDLLRELSTAHNEKIQMVNGQEVAGDVNGSTDRINIVRQQQSIEFDRLRSEAFNAIYQAERLRETDSEKALELIDESMTKLAGSSLPAEQTDALAARLRNSRNSIEKYREQRAPMIELQKRNEEVRDQIEQERKMRIRVEQDLADMTEEFNRLMRERRFPEAEVVAKKAKELAPEEPVTELMVWKARFAKRIQMNDEVKDGKEESFWSQLHAVDESSINPVTKDSIAYPDPKEWRELTKSRRQFSGPDNRERTPEELEIIDSLSQPISLHFDNEPLSEVFRQIAQLANINIWTDEQGLEEVGASSNTPVTMHIDGIKLRSALNLLLEPYGLDYSIDDDVLKVTSSLRLQGELVPVVYNVADLVVPLPVLAGQFAPNNGVMGATPLGGMNSIPSQPFGNSMSQISDPLAMAGNGGGTGLLGNSDARDPRQSQADFDALSELITSVVRPESWDHLGGNGVVRENASTLSLVIRQTQAVHDEIAELLKQLRRLQDLQVTIEVRFITVSDRFFERIGIDFDFNVQDTIGGPEVDDSGIPLPAFGTVDTTGGSTQGNQGGGNNNNNNNQQNQQGQQGQQGIGGGLFDQNPVLNLVNRDRYQSGGTIVGMNSPDSFSQDLDIPFRQGSFQVGVPDFGNFNPEVGIQVGFAVLSDIEAFFFIQAAQSDERSNILFAPKVTLFNGQRATVADQVSRPFVISLTPSVSVFNVGFQPQIQFINEGVNLEVLAVISADRRYVRLSVLPTFTNITDVQTFTFAGGGGGIGGGQQGGFGGQQGGQGGGFGGQGGGFGGGGGGNLGFGGIGGFGGQQGGGQGGFGGQQGGQQGQQGQQGGAIGGSVTVQQPIQEQVFVSTVVSVPDGGTVLLGGVKRLREGRNMAGVPILNKIPYVSRLFKNTGVGRETESLMLMVTPRIIIQEEEEQLLGIELD